MQKQKIPSPTCFQFVAQFQAISLILTPFQTNLLQQNINNSDKFHEHDDHKLFGFNTAIFQENQQIQDVSELLQHEESEQMKKITDELISAKHLLSNGMISFAYNRKQLKPLKSCHEEEKNEKMRQFFKNRARRHKKYEIIIPPGIKTKYPE